MLTSSTWSFNVLSREVFVEMTRFPLAQGLFPCISKEPDGSLLLLWWRLAVIVSPKVYHGKARSGPVEAPGIDQDSA